MNEGKAGFLEYKNKFENFLKIYFVDKMPALPVSLKDRITEYGPYIAILVLIIGVFSLVPLLLGVFTVAALSNAAGNAFDAYVVFLSLFFYIPTLVLEIIALPGLIKLNKSKGWDYLFYAFLLNILYAVLTFNVISTLLHLFALYVLFQIREYYK